MLALSNLPKAEPDLPENTQMRNAGNFYWPDLPQSWFPLDSAYGEFLYNINGNIDYLHLNNYNGPRWDILPHKTIRSLVLLKSEELGLGETMDYEMLYTYLRALTWFPGFAKTYPVAANHPLRRTAKIWASRYREKLAQEITTNAFFVPPVLGVVVWSVAGQKGVKGDSFEYSMGNLITKTGAHSVNEALVSRLTREFYFPHDLVMIIEIETGELKTVLAGGYYFVESGQSAPNF